jgi:flagellar biosynthesis protein FlhG
LAVKHAELPVTAENTAEQASDLERWVRQARSERARRAGRTPAPQLRVAVVTGGKGGVGKSNFSLNFSLALRERGRRVLLVDCDSGLGNLDVLLGLCPQRHLGHVLAGACSVEEALLEGPLGLRLLPAASGIEAIGRATGVEVGRLVQALGRLAEAYDLCVLDSGAGLGPQVRALLRAAGEIVCVTTPEPTALADAYATVKAIHRDNPRAATSLVVNMADNPRDAEGAARSVEAVCRRFLDWSPRYLGAVPRDPAVLRAVREQRPFLLGASASSPAGRALRAIAAAFCEEAAPAAARPVGLRELLLSLVRPRPDGDAEPAAATDRAHGGAAV